MRARSKSNCLSFRSSWSCCRHKLCRELALSVKCTTKSRTRWRRRLRTSMTSSGWMRCDCKSSRRQSDLSLKLRNRWKSLTLRWEPYGCATRISIKSSTLSSENCPCWYTINCVRGLMLSQVHSCNSSKCLRKKSCWNYWTTWKSQRAWGSISETLETGSVTMVTSWKTQTEVSFLSLLEKAMTTGQRWRMACL